MMRAMTRVTRDETDAGSQHSLSVRRYRNNRLQKFRDERRQRLLSEDEGDEEAGEGEGRD
jgi:hypothetical protein